MLGHIQAQLICLIWPCLFLAMVNPQHSLDEDHYFKLHTIFHEPVGDPSIVLEESIVEVISLKFSAYFFSFLAVINTTAT